MFAQTHRIKVTFSLPNVRDSKPGDHGASHSVNLRLFRTPTDIRESQQHTQMLVERHLNPICLRSKINLYTCE